MKKSSIIWAIVWILAAVFLVISQLGFLEGIGAFTIVFTIILAAIIIKSVHPLNFAGLFFPAAVLCILYDSQLHIEQLTPWTVLLAALLLTIGFEMLRGLISSKYRRNSHHEWIIKSTDETEFDDNGFVSKSISFGSCTKYINSESFRGGELNSSFGGMEIYFDHAQMEGDSADLYVNAKFSGIELYIPKNWKVENHAVASFGAVEEQPCPPDTDKTLVLKGNISFGAVEIHYI